MVIKKRVFISFDVDHDEGTKHMLAGQAKLPDSPFDFKDNSVKEHLTGDWKEKVKLRMNNIDVVIILCGTTTHTASGVAAELLIAKEKGKPYFLLAAYSDRTCTKPTSASSTDSIYTWTWENLKKLINGAR
ncbi:TIR domain-containing protein [Sulfurospirillum arsenophilum]|uniref:TIR domain-containing protein n=1 Tax=Sulfurospirillum arsenophilum TaxID=56698 RepID=UPI0005A66934|nr:TIR domain-containing protein [Sulfurospirillum arsenophilum]